MTTPRGSLRRSLQLLDDVTLPRQLGVQCDPCQNEAKHRNAVKFCQQCRQNMCKTCVEQHAKFMTTKHHSLIRKLETSLKNLNVIIDTCHLHKGKLLDMYCGSHDEVCCTICAAVNHRSCDDVSYIPEAAKDVENSVEYLLLRRKLTSLRNMFSHMKHSRERFITRIPKQKETAFDKIRSFKEEMIRKMDVIEKKSQEEVENFYQKEERVSRNNISICDDLLSLIDSVANRFKEAKREGNEPKLFVEMKLLHRKYKQFSAAADNVMGRKPRRVLFESSSTLQKLLEEENGALGQLKIRATPEFVGRQFSAQLRSDDKVCDIRGSAALPQGKFLLADYANRKLKMVDTAYSCKPVCSFSSGPVSVSYVTSDEVIVSLPQEWRIALVNMSNFRAKYRITRDARVLTSKGKHIFVLESTHSLDDDVGMVPSLKLNKLRWDYVTPVQEQIFVVTRNLIDPLYYPDPTGICIGQSPNVVHIVDRHAGLFTVTKNRQQVEVKRFIDKDLIDAFNIDHDATGDLFVTGRGSNNVMRMSRDGKRLLILLSEADGLKRPQAVSFDDENQRILVGMQNSNTLLVFDIGFDSYGHYWEKDLIFGSPRKHAVSMSDT